MDLFGLGKTGSTLAIGFIVVSALTGVYLYWEGKVIDAAGADASREAHEEKSEFERDLKNTLRQLEDESARRARELEERFKAFEKLQQEAWDERLQNEPDFVARANRRTNWLWDCRQQRLQEIFAGGAALPPAAGACTGDFQAD